MEGKVQVLLFTRIELTTPALCKLFLLLIVGTGGYILDPSSSGSSLIGGFLLDFEYEGGE